MMKRQKRRIGTDNYDDSNHDDDGDDGDQFRREKEHGPW